MKNAYLIQFEKYVDERGALIPFEYNKNCPFDVKRCFFVYNIPTFSRRGNHINIKSKNLLVAINGSCKVKVVYDNIQNIFILNSPDIGLFIDKNVYREIYEFDSNCILLCISDTIYQKEEYIET